MLLMVQRENEKCDNCLFVYLEVLCVLNVLWFECHVDFTCFMFIFNATCAKRLKIIADVMHKFWACKAQTCNTNAVMQSANTPCKKPLMHMFLLSASVLVNHSSTAGP